jgi:KUP system potassium uptake protein
VLSAVEGLKYVTPVFEPYILWISIVILIALFAVQSRGTGKVATFFGPIMLVWFLTLGALGVMHIGDDWASLRRSTPIMRPLPALATAWSGCSCSARCSWR